ncbi:MAG: hypothetical protein AAFY71_04560 [Bacteroidota bacterium]
MIINLEANQFKLTRFMNYLPNKSKSLVTNHTVCNQQLFEENRQKISSKPYAKYLNPEMYVYDEHILNAQKGPIPPSEILPPTIEGLNKLLEPGYLPHETGYGQMADGTLFASSLTHFPHATPEMLQWWFWWHSVEAERYALWYPYCHVSAMAENREVLSQSNLHHSDRYIGNTHKITEYLFDEKNDIHIHFVDPLELGFDTTKFKKVGIKAHACGFVSLQSPPIVICTMVHLARETDYGFELRSRYYMGHNAQINLMGRDIKFPSFLRQQMLKKAGLQVAYEQVLHDQIEFTHLASFLPDLYQEFGSDL